MDDENIDFNISGVPNAMVKRLQSISVHNLIQKIESHPQREAIQNDLQQHCAFNPFSEESKDAIMAAGNTELCEMINVEPKLQCKACLKHWSAGIVYCTCGHLMEDDSAESKKYISSVLDLFSIPNCYIRKGRPHGHRYGKAPGCKEYHTANQLQRKCRKKKYDIIHDRFIREKTFRKAMIELGRSEKIILEMDQLASENHTHVATRAEIDVYRGNWWIRSNVVNSIRCRQGINLTSRRRCRHCTASRKRSTRSNVQSGHKVPPHGGSGTQTGGSSNMRTHHKDGVTTD